MVRTRIVEDNLVSPRGIALHPALGKLYWTDWDTYNPRNKRRTAFANKHLSRRTYVRCGMDRDEKFAPIFKEGASKNTNKRTIRNDKPRWKTSTKQIIYRMAYVNRVIAKSLPTYI